jgi:hypothetical protein
MNKTSAALAAALFSVFGVAANDSHAQMLIQPPSEDGPPQILIIPPEGPAADPDCGPLTQMHTGLENLDEKPLAMGLLKGGQEVFMLYGDQVGHTWTVIHAKPDGSEACTKLSGEDLKVMPLETRGPGIPIALKQQTDAQKKLEEIEFKLSWKFQESLQMTGQSEQGQLRVYANTDSKTFTLLIMNKEKGPRIGNVGRAFVSPEEIARKNLHVAQPAPEAAPGLSHE